jgi:Caspase domain
MNKKIISSIVVCLLISITFGTCVLVDAKSTDDNKIGTLDGTSRWAVIIGISDYYNGSGSDLPSPALDAKRLDAVLKVRSHGWDPNKIRLLVNSDAKRQNILDSLDWLAEKANAGDTIFFFFSGHGIRVVDKNGDEKDGLDEVICPYDYDTDFVNFTFVNPVNFITDDELSEKFDNISAKNVKGMFIVINSCLSGGLFDWKKGGESAAQEKKNLINEFQDANNYTSGVSEDIDSGNRVILTGSLPFTLGEEFFGSLSFGKAVGRAFQFGKKTAEDIARFARSWWLGKPQVIKGLIMGIILAPFDIAAFREVGLGMIFAFPYPMLKDGYPLDKPFSEKLQIID